MTRTGRGWPASAVTGLRRARAERGHLLAVLLVLVVALTLAGALTTSLTGGLTSATAAVLARAEVPERTVQVRVSLADEAPAVAAETMEQARVALTTAVAPLPSATSTWWSTSLRLLPDSAGGSAGGDAGAGGDDAGPPLGYLAAGTDLADRSELTSGRWPQPQPAGVGGGPWEVAVPDATAAGLGLQVGAVLPLRGARSEDPVPADVDVVVVGTFSPRTTDPQWALDPLQGRGFSPAQPVPGSYGPTLRPAWGPFVLAPEVLSASAVAPPGVRPRQAHLLLTADTGAVPADAPARVRAGLGALGDDLRSQLSSRVEGVLVRAPLAGLLAATGTARGVAVAELRVFALEGAVLVLAALALAGGLLAGHRAGDEALVAVRGASPGQRVVRSATESLLLALVAVLVAVPLSQLVVARLSAATAGAAAPTVTNPLVTDPTTWLVVGGVGVVLAGVLTAWSSRTVRPAVGSRAARAGVVARSGADLVLVAAAVAACVQLRVAVTSGDTTDPGADPLRVLAPVLCLLAGTVLALRVVDLVRGLAERVAGRADGVLLPLTGWELARRPATGAVLVLVLAGGVAGSALAGEATWRGAQGDQADLAVGADLSVVPATDPAAAGPVVSATTTGVVRAVTDRPVALGTRVGRGGATSATRLLATDTTVAGALFRGRPPTDGDWPAAVAGLAPLEPATGAPVDVVDGRTTLTVSGSVGTDATPSPQPVTATLTLVVQDVRGARAAVSSEPVALDGAAHAVVLALPAGGGQVVAVRWHVRPDGPGDGGASPEQLAVPHPVSLSVDLPGSRPSDARWFPQPGPASALTGATVSSSPSVTVAGTTLSTTGVLVPGQLSGLGSDVVATVFPSVPEVAVVMTQPLADDLGVGAGGRLDVGVGSATVGARVLRVVPYLPSHPRGPLLLADVDTLSRALLQQRDLGSLTDGWWAEVPDAEAPAARRTVRETLGTAAVVRTRTGLADNTTSDPLAAGQLLGRRLLSASAFGLGVAAVLLQSATQHRRRTRENARLRAVGVGRRTLVAATLLRHGVTTVLAVGLGSLVGLVVARVVQPLLVLATDGRRPVPTVTPELDLGAQLVWPLTLAAVVTALVLPVALTGLSRLRALDLRQDGTP